MGYFNKNKLYKKLSYLFSEHVLFMENREKANKEEIRYLRYIYENTLIVSGLTLLINDFEENRSIGCFVEIRKIIETFAILSAIERDHFSADQLALAIISGTYMSLVQFIDFYAPIISTEDSDLGKTETERKDQFVADAIRITGFSKEETKRFLKKQYGFIGFKEKGKPLSQVSIYSFIKKELGKEQADYWHYSNKNIHPSFYSSSIFTCMRKDLEEAINRYLIMIEQYFDECSGDIDLSKIKSYKSKKADANNEKTIRAINKIKRVFDKCFVIKSEYDSNSYFEYSFQIIKELLIDVLLVKQFIGPEYSISRSKCIFEYSSILYHVNKTKSYDLWNELSDIRIYSYLKGRLNDVSMPTMDNIISKFKERYPSVELSDQELGMILKEDLLYFLYGHNIKFMKMVEEVVNECCPVSDVRELTYSIYKNTLDDSHSRCDGFKAIIYKNTRVLKKIGHGELYFYLIVVLEKCVGTEMFVKRYKDYYDLLRDLFNEYSNDIA